MKKALVICVLVGMAFLATQKAEALCLFSCVPSEADGKAVFTNLLKKEHKNEPFTITSFEKTNGIEGEAMGLKIYELKRANVVFSRWHKYAMYRCKT